MKNLFLILFSLAISTAIATANFKTLNVEEVSALVQQRASVVIYDANTEKVRKETGIIPGAKLLSSSSDYDVAQTLPADKSTKLVFYCAGKLCSSSHAAAKRALDHGYTNVSVMAEGIKGWLKAGKPVSKL
jgi:rhodanese-related sulfurtransferase